jgi:hypothetical protein
VNSEKLREPVCDRIECLDWSTGIVGREDLQIMALWDSVIEMMTKPELESKAYWQMDQTSSKALPQKNQACHYIRIAESCRKEKSDYSQRKSELQGAWMLAYATHMCS